MSCDCCLGCCCYSQPGNAGMPTLFNQVTNSWSSPARFKSRGPGCAAVRPSATWQARTTCPGIIGKSYAASNWVNGWIDPITGTRKTISWQVNWGGMTVTPQQGSTSVTYSPRYIFPNCVKCLPLCCPPPPPDLPEEYYKCCQGFAEERWPADGTIRLPEDPHQAFTLREKYLSAVAYLWTKCDGQPHVYMFVITMSVHIGPPSPDAFSYFQTKTNIYTDPHGGGLALSQTAWQNSPSGWRCACWDQNILDDPQFSINLAP